MSTARKVRWGIISTADIGIEKMIPGMLKSPHSEIVALGSRDKGRAEEALAKFGLKKARSYSSYEELLADPEIDAVYNPLPNHLHVPLTLAAARAGKHVLCEKPIAITAAEAAELRAIPDNIIVSEAFVVWHHPQWHRVREIVASGELGEVHAVRAIYTYFNTDPHNVRNIADIGGGGILDIGCYPVAGTRFVLGREPKRVVALVDRDPSFKTDRLASVIADFGDGVHLNFICGTQTVPRQSVEVLGSKARVELVIPFNAPLGERTAILVDAGAIPDGHLARREIVRNVDQFTEEAENFALAVLGEGPLPLGVEYSILQMKVLDAIFRSERSGGWEPI